MVDERPDSENPREGGEDRPTEETRDLHADSAPLSDDDIPTWPSFTSGPIPEAFAGYKITREIHRGGQGVVYLAIQQSTRRKVAIKVMKEGPFAHPADRVRFEREVQILGQLNHPNIVSIHDSGVVAGCHYLVMDYIRGTPLDEYIEDRKLEIDRGRGDRGSPGSGGSAAPGGGPARGLSIDATLRLFHKICAAVEAAHLRGIIHRDLKPRNILIDEKNEPHVLDFGLAKTAIGGSDLSVMTATGQFIGSLPWASPEQAEGKPGMIDVRTDVYSLGVILYQMLTGRFPYEVIGTMRDVLDRIMTAEPARPSTIRKQINDDVETIVLKCLNKDKERRYQSAGSLGRDVALYLAGEPIEARRASVIYLLRARTSALIRRHALLACFLIFVFSVGVAYWPGIPLIGEWLPLQARYESFASSFYPSPNLSQPYDDIRVITIASSTPLGVLADAIGEDEAYLAQDIKRYRRVHGLMMKKLAAAGAAVIVWAISFGSPSEYDQPFLEGIQAARKAGTEVVLATKSCTRDVEGLPAINRDFLTAGTRWGCALAGIMTGTEWRIPIAVKEGLNDPVPSLALAAYIAFRKPGMEADLRLNKEANLLSVVYWKPSPFDRRAKRTLDEHDVIELTGVESAGGYAAALGLGEDDEIAQYYLKDLRDEEALQAATMDYAAALTADPADMRARFKSKIVMICDGRDPNLYATDASGRRVLSNYVHTTALDQLLRDQPVRTHSAALLRGTLCLAAAAGLVIGWVCVGRRWLRWLLLLAGIAACIGVSLWLAHHRAMILNPLLPVTALLVAGLLTIQARGMYEARRA